MTTIELVDKIKRILADPEGVTEEELFALASEYATRCRRLNDRLSRAVYCVRTGALCEADRLEREWSLLENFRELTFSGAEDWREVCRSLNCDVAAFASAENAAELQDFCDVYENSRELFSRLRRLAMTAAPLPERLETLYQLYVNFPQHQTLRHSIDTLEKARVEEITLGLKDSANRNSTSFLQESLAELVSPERINRPPRELIDKLNAALDQRQGVDAAARLRDVLERWASAKLDNDDAKMLETLNFYRASGMSSSLKMLTPDEREALSILESESVKLERRRDEERRQAREASRSASSSPSRPAAPPVRRTPPPPPARNNAAPPPIPSDGGTDEGASSGFAVKRSTEPKARKKRGGKLALLIVVAAVALALFIVVVVVLTSRSGAADSVPEPSKTETPAESSKDKPAAEGDKAPSGSDPKSESKPAADAELAPAPTALDGLDAFSVELAGKIGNLSTYKSALEGATTGVTDAQNALIDIGNASIVRGWNECAAFKNLNGALQDAERFETALAIAEDEGLSAIPEHQALKEKLDRWSEFGLEGGLAAAKETLKGALAPFLIETYLYYKPDAGEYVYLTSKPDGTTPVQRVLENGMPVEFKEEIASPEKIGVSTVYTIAQNAASEDKNDLKSFLDGVLDAIEKTLSATDEEADPCAKLALVDALIAALNRVPGGDEFRTRFDNAYADVVDLDYDFYSVKDQHDSRGGAVKALNSLGSLPGLCGTLKRSLEADLDLTAETYDWIGFIDVLDGKALVNFGSNSPVDGAELYLFHGEDCEAIRVGTTSNGGAKLLPGHDWTKYRWSPVYAHGGEAE